MFFLQKQKEHNGQFSVTFCGVQKVTKNTPRASALWTPGERFKALYRHAIYRDLSGSYLKQLSCFEPVRKGYFTA